MITRNPRDYLNLASNSAFLQCVSKFRSDPENVSAFFGVDASKFQEDIVFSVEVVKINRKG